MLRDATIPLFLWIATAIVVHLVWGGGADRTANMLKQTREIRSFAASVQQNVSWGGPMDLAFVTLPDDDSEDATELTLPKPPKPKPKPKKDTTPSPPKPKPLEPKPLMQKKKKLAEKKEKKKEKSDELKPFVLPQVKRRIAIRQHPTNEVANPDAHFIANKANRVKEETQARITSTDRDQANPTPGSHRSAPHEAPGDSDETRIAQSEDREGEKRAPTASEAQRKVAKLESRASTSKTDSRKPRSAREARPALEARDQQTQVATGDAAWSASDKDQKAQAAMHARRARRPLFPRKRPRSPWDIFGLDSAATTNNGINLNLTRNDALAVVGHDELIKDRQRDAELRRSKHRGAWKSTGLERWRSAIENYVPSVKPGNTTALNAAAVPFANYLNAFHNRLHPIFADGFLRSLDHLPASHPLNRMDMSTNLEIVLSRDDGRVVRMGVTKTSGVTAFDVGALESVSRAQPFGTPPKEIVSPDGNVYLHWEFYRNPIYACSTYFARPFLLRAAPKTAPPRIEPPHGGPPQEDRHGQVSRDRSRLHATR